MLRDSTVVAVVVAVVRTRPQAIPQLMIAMRKSIHGFLFPYMVMGLHLASLRAAGAPLLLKYTLEFFFLWIYFIFSKFYYYLYNYLLI